MNGDWEELRADFCHSFSLIECINSLLIDILNFEQLEKESIGAAWARFLRLLASSPDLSIPDDVSLNTFCSGLDIVGVYRQACSGIPLAVGFVGRSTTLELDGTRNTKI
jgi:hypothetical protein